MAKMFPAEETAFTTAGEEAVYHFFRRAARPDSSHICWYSPDIADKEPDFILLSPDCGLIVFEVKDWALSQIRELNPKKALLRLGKREEWRDQPLAQARKYVNQILSLFSKDGGKQSLPCPVSWGAVFPHISRQDWLASGLDEVIGDKYILFWDDLQEDSAFLKDVSGKNFSQWLLEHFPPKFQFSLTAASVEYIRRRIFPIVRLNLPRRPASDQTQALLCLDSEQENLARRLGSGNLLISGPAGSGKTLLLATRSACLASANRNIRRILITCFNLSLVGYIRRLALAKGAPNAQLDVIPFYQLCESIVGQKLAHTNEGADYYDIVIQESLEALQAHNHPLKGAWDAILVDEGQDFSMPMAQVVLNLLPEHGSLTVAQDSNQRLYQAVGVNWSSLPITGLQARELKSQYRNTRNIAKYAANYLGAPEPASKGALGKKPEILVSGNAQAMVAAIADKVAMLVAAGVAMNEIAILYFKSRLSDGESLPELLLREIERRGVLGRWLSRDISCKNYYDITTDSVTISTIHSVKGMDFAHVFLAGFEAEATGEQIRRLGYVGMTRARERLYLCQWKC